MIKVPFDTPYHGETIRGEVLGTVDLGRTLDKAYNSMAWFKYLADHAIEVKVLEAYYDSPKRKTTHVVGFKLEDKHETFYRLKYHREE